MPKTPTRSIRGMDPGMYSLAVEYGHLLWLSCDYCDWTSIEMEPDGTLTLRDLLEAAEEHDRAAEHFPNQPKTPARSVRVPEDLGQAAKVVMAEVTPGDHPYSDPGDGRTECDRCGKWIWPAIHSCKGVPVTEAAKQRMPDPGAILPWENPDGTPARGAQQDPEGRPLDA